MSCSEKKGKPDSDTIIDMPNLKAKFAFKGRIVFQSDMDGDREIYLLTAGGIKKLTNNSWDDEYPKWSPDGGKIAYSANPTGNYDIFIMDEDGSNITQITASTKNETSPAWFPDGKKFAYTIEEKKGFVKRSSLWMVDLELKKKTKIIPQFRGHSALPNLSQASPIMGF
ncbi:MAG: DPP IV N-terminal domain-containing protein, partial [Acidobacteriota bacterium]|nr:DPP IV N-terminal domain-containing protein [Acidobacteriota bacterium]